MPCAKVTQLSRKTRCLKEISLEMALELRDHPHSFNSAPLPPLRLVFILWLFYLMDERGWEEARMSEGNFWEWLLPLIPEAKRILESHQWFSASITSHWSKLDHVLIPNCQRCWREGFWKGRENVMSCLDQLQYILLNLMYYLPEQRRSEGKSV